MHPELYQLTRTLCTGVPFCWVSGSNLAVKEKVTRALHFRIAGTYRPPILPNPIPMM